MADQQQPDFGVIAQGFEDLGHQFARCANLPGVAPAAAAADQFAAIQRALARIEGQMETRLGQIESRLGRIEMRQVVSDSNGIARGLNAAVTNPEQFLHPLRALATNEEIPDFPSRLQDIDGLNGHMLGMILRALDQPSGGGVAEKRKQFKRAIGMRAEAL
ncbi:hypothetical protein MAPG_10735 [Magnaporthiopsis poae ATCC 64411]|uniref:Uncharacterized protein n=1 Tax=Magnaporthiopsis poae (strain ATCC 64411 / 73-15) TaxID=644358 RepID=A0A0C4EDD7_MAGP6|nr:hypothetical protein MAPG_10735 [Magnaporthiopsis poae ATCC 64411]